MIILLFIVIIILLGVIYLQYKSNRERQLNIKYIHEKLMNIMKNGTSEKLLTFTDNKELKKLLIAINKILEHNQKIQGDYIRAESSMRKMLSNISHDLKTPLTVVLGYIETMMLDNTLTQEERQTQLLKTSHKANEVLQLINKFFNLAKLESGDEDISLTRINLNEICRKNILDFYDSLNAKGFIVDIDIPENTIYALGNEEALYRIMNNLISNAIKYGSDGKTLGLSLSCDENCAYIQVWDKGKGIDEIHKDKVFERMYTMEDSRNKLYEGSGLGLTITKRLVGKLQGEIYLTSKPYEKTTFTLKFNKIVY